MEISSLNNKQVISSLTVEQLEVIVTQIVQKVISKQQESLIPDEYKQEIPFDSNATPFWQVVVDNSSKIPETIWDSIPSDASEKIDVYLYGTKT
jgi:hypothetical protein